MLSRLQIAFILTAALLSAQRSNTSLFRTEADLIVCHARVRDKKDRPILDLPKAAFTVYDDGQPQPIRVFTHEDSPVSLGLVIDNSAGMCDKRARVVAASMSLVGASNPSDEIFVVNFNEEAYLDLPYGKDFTHKPEEIQQALSRIEARGNSCVRDAVAKALAHLEAKAHNRNKVLVIVTNGKDDASIITKQDLLRAAHQSDALIYVVGLLNAANCGEQLGATRRDLRDLAEATGGQAFFPKSVEQVESITHQIAFNIRAQYVIGYRSPDGITSDDFRQIKITLNTDAHLTVHTRSGYYPAKTQ